MIAEVLLPLAVDKSFDYKIPTDLALAKGDWVQVPFHNKIYTGVVKQVKETSSFKELKIIQKKLSFSPLHEKHLDFIQWVGAYNIVPLGLVFKMMVSKKALDPCYKPKKKLELSLPQTIAFSLSTDQKQAAETLKQAFDLKKYQPFLLDGVTGSGKTEVYLDVVEYVLKNQKQGLVLLPEIALSSAWMERFFKHFGCYPFIWHSDVSESMKAQTWRYVLEGRPCIVAGTRSALFLPFSNLGFIVVDEEHDASFKQEDQVIYHARDMAVVRARIENIPLCLVSATPSLESLVNVEKGRYQYLKLSKRFGQATLPTVQLIDMCQENISKNKWLSLPLIKAIQEKLALKEQIFLFLNRRGYAPLTLCRKCGYRFMCPSCTFWLVEHKRTQKLHCHHCGFETNLAKECPHCHQNDSFVACGPGVERILEEVKQYFPQAQTLLVTKDTLASFKDIQETLRKINDCEVDIIIGTQILAKGHHFAQMTLVGVIDADLGLSGGDLRACEKTYQLLHQVAGRAGRDKKEGHVLIQTYQKDHSLMQALQHNDRDGFLACESEQRRFYQMPPYGQFASVLFSGLKADQVEKTAKIFAQKAHISLPFPDFHILGPTPSSLSLLRGRHRWRMLIRTLKEKKLSTLLKKLVESYKPIGNVRIVVDMDPIQFL
ncbi:MAG: primosomal protein N' [Proteobacteria bacterium]|nr:primosomal protein N' [Pseudomonadota bacterium]